MDKEPTPRTINVYRAFERHHASEQTSEAIAISLYQPLLPSPNPESQGIHLKIVVIVTFENDVMSRCTKTYPSLCGI